MRIAYNLFLIAAVLLVLHMIAEDGIERGIEIGIEMGREECELATGYPFEDIIPNRIEPLCWKILQEKYNDNGK